MNFQSAYIAKKPDQNGYIAYTPEEDHTWHQLIVRQKEIIKSRACYAFLTGLSLLNFSHDHVPQCVEVSNALRKVTGWSVKPVEALISAEEFFTLLANCQFPAASFVRRPEELDYLQEPDIFHEFFGHCPMIAHQPLADFMQQYGQLALRVSEEERVLLARLYWFTVEFGLVNTPNGYRIYGGGILSSKGETIYCLKDPHVVYKPFTPLDAFRTPYRIDIMQPLYYVIQDFKELYTLDELKLRTLMEQAHQLGDYPAPFEDLKQQALC